LHPYLNALLKRSRVIGVNAGSIPAGCANFPYNDMPYKDPEQRRLRHKEWMSPEYQAWTDIKSRCLRPSHKAFPHYGGRGIKICDRWLYSFNNFLSDLGQRPSKLHSVDRIDNDGNYEPSNCRWATKLEQSTNRRNTKWIVYNEEKISVSAFARIAGVKATNMHSRINRGWTMEECLHGRRKRTK